eukprot:TRINITY_DN868_c1_g2_i1.p1 TRINITY_DN868_c1_g2~~TRINITY_DN868_c1_g2_i1.p1  ORF type:complete len:811 (-),score=199.09 TRINITY_DN868_c1_g2_i1:25-2457(-)
MSNVETMSSGGSGGDVDSFIEDVELGDAFEGATFTPIKKKSFWQNKIAVGLVAVLAVLIIAVGIILTVKAASSEENHSAQGDDEVDYTQVKTLIQAMKPIMDTTQDPCNNFYLYSCGGWIKQQNSTPPSDQATFSLSFNSIRDRNLMLLNQTLLQNWPKVSTMYQNCMAPTSNISSTTLSDPSFINLLHSVTHFNSTLHLIQIISNIHKLGFPSFFNFGSEPDLKNSSVYIAGFAQGGLSLSTNRDYYVNYRNSSLLSNRRALFIKHVTKYFELYNQIPSSNQLPKLVSTPTQSAQSVMKIETFLANASYSLVQLRNPDYLYHPFTLSQFLSSFNVSISNDSNNNSFWEHYLSELSALDTIRNHSVTINVVNPHFYRNLSILFSNLDFDRQDGATDENIITVQDVKNYLFWNVLRTSTPFLSEAFRNESFLWTKVLTGVDTIPPRWKTCVGVVQNTLGWFLGHLYTLSYFNQAQKTRVENLITNLRSALHHSFDHSSWMDTSTKLAAINKLEGIAQKIGFPDQWDVLYESVEILPGNYFKSYQNAAEYAVQNDIKRIGTIVNRKDNRASDWGMTPEVVNAYYDPTRNEIAFPAGILQPPFYRSIEGSGPNNDGQKTKHTSVVNYAGIGSVIGHELTHAFDDEGSKFDINGNSISWWNDTKVVEAFNLKADCVSDWYSTYSSANVSLNGRLTLGENIADMGGAKNAYYAWRDNEREKEGVKDEEIERLWNEVGGGGDLKTLEQMFWVGYGQNWCVVQKEDYLRSLMLTNPHSPGEFRVNGVVSNSEEFHKAFGCKSTDRMFNKDWEKCQIW